jgi:hypothetical protein
MKWIALLVSVLLALPAAAQPRELYDGHVSIALPAGFRAMTPAEIEQKYPPTQPPQFAFTDDDRFTQTIAISRIRFPAGRPPTLDEIGGQMRQRIAVQSGVTVRRHGPVEIGGRRWYAIDFGSTAIGQPVENMMRITMADGHIFILAANAISRLFEEKEAGLRDAIGSVRLH